MPAVPRCHAIAGAAASPSATAAGTTLALGNAVRLALWSRAGMRRPQLPDAAPDCQRLPYRLGSTPASSARAITMRCTSLVPSPISPSFASRR